MTLELLICTLDDGIQGIAEHLEAPCDGVCYLCSCQYTTPQPPPIPSELCERDDVRVVFLPGAGLCRNRNNALDHAVGDVLMICDDDERVRRADFDRILKVYEAHPEFDIVHFQTTGLHKDYPPRYVSSVEMTLRRERIGSLRFDERFGLGSPCLNACEETVFLSDAARAGLRVHYEPVSICTMADGDKTTGSDPDNPLLLRSKGAAFCYTRGLWYALYKSLRESLGQMIRHDMNPIRTFRHMLWGINYIRRWQPSQS